MHMPFSLFAAAEQRKRHKNRKMAVDLFRNGEPDYTAISNVSLFKGIPSDHLKQIGSQLCCRECRFTQGEMIIRCGDAVTAPAIVANGMANAAVNAAALPQAYDEGRFTVGDILGLEAVFSTRHISPYDIVTAAGGCVLIFFDPSPLLERPDFASRFTRNWLKLLSDRYVSMAYRVSVLSQRSLREKILRYIYLMCRGRKSHCFYQNMTQNEFAAYLRVARPSLNRELQALKREGFLLVEGRRFTLLKLPDDCPAAWPVFAKTDDRTQAD